MNLITRCWLGGLYLLLAVVSFYCFRGKGSHSTFVAVFLVYSLLALASSADLRRRFRNTWSVHWKKAGAFAQNGGRAPWWSAIFLVGVPALILGLASGRNITPFDNYGAMLTAASLVQHGTNNLTQLLGGREIAEKLCASEFWILCTKDGAYSSFPSGVVPFVLPFFLLARLAGANLYDHDVLWHLASFSASHLAAVIAVLTFLLALQIVPVRAAYWVSAFVFAGSAVFSTVSQGLWSHNGVTLALMAALLVALSSKALTPKSAVLIGIALSLMFAGRVASAVMIVPILLWVAVRDFKIGILAGIVSLLALVPWALVYQLSYGHVMGPQFLLLNRMPGAFAPKNIPVGLYGLLGSPGTGLFIYQPWVWIAVGYGVYRMRATAKKEKDRLAPHWPWLALVLCLALLFEMASWVGWTGQWCWGTRYLTEVMPLLALLCAPGVSLMLQRKNLTRVLQLLMLLSFLVQANYVYGVGGFWSGEPEDPDAVPQMADAQLRGILLTNSRCLDWRDPAFLYPYFQRFFPPPQYARKHAKP